ncbi:unnamed protein product [Amoebophrya sp. A25]|nr:unnamed protein product [Amoebophrya sp. A25]|eukprot:GSA25T00001431001.1
MKMRRRILISLPSVEVRQPQLRGGRCNQCVVVSIRRLLYSTRRRQVHLTTLGSPFWRSRNPIKKKGPCGGKLIDWLIDCGLID